MNQENKQTVAPLTGSDDTYRNDTPTLNLSLLSLSATVLCQSAQLPQVRQAHFITRYLFFITSDWIL